MWERSPKVQAVQGLARRNRTVKRLFPVASWSTPWWPSAWTLSFDFRGRTTPSHHFVHRCSSFCVLNTLSTDYLICHHVLQTTRVCNWLSNSGNACCPEIHHGLVAAVPSMCHRVLTDASLDHHLSFRPCFHDRPQSLTIDGWYDAFGWPSQLGMCIFVLTFRPPPVFPRWRFSSSGTALTSSQLYSSGGSSISPSFFAIPEEVAKDSILMMVWDEHLLSEKLFL